MNLLSCCCLWVLKQLLKTAVSVILVPVSVVWLSCVHGVRIVLRFVIMEVMFMRRHKLPLRKSKRMFSKHSSHPHPMNMLSGAGGPMRGGIRL